MTASEPRTPNWWDPPADAMPPPPTPLSHLDAAGTRLSIAAVVQESTGGNRDIAQQLSTWCMALMQGNADLATIQRIIHGLDRMARDECEPQTWFHLKQAEVALAAHLRAIRSNQDQQR